MMTRRNSILGFVSILLLAQLAGCFPDDPTAPGSRPYSCTESFDFVIEGPGFEELQLYAINGPVEIEGTGGANVAHIWGVRRARAITQQLADDSLDDLFVDIDTVGGVEVDIMTDHPSDTSDLSFEVEYHITLPREWDLAIHTTNGDVELEDIHGDVIVVATNGELLLTDLQGDVLGQVTNGLIDARVVVPPAGSCRLSCTNGSIELDIPTSTSARFSASTTNGGISVSGLSFFDWNSTPTRANGTLGDGYGQVILTVLNGNIAVAGY